MLIAKGFEIFDLSLSKDDAIKKKLVDEAIQANDLKKEEENLANNGMSNEELEKLLKQIQEAMKNAVNSIIYDMISGYLFKSYNKLLDEIEVMGSPEDIEKIKHMRSLFNDKMNAMKNQSQNETQVQPNNSLQTTEQNPTNNTNTKSFIQTSSKMLTSSLMKAAMELIESPSLTNIHNIPPNFVESKHTDEFNS